MHYNSQKDRAVDSVIALGSPRVFSKKSAMQYNESLGDKTLRVNQKGDIVTDIPPKSYDFEDIGKAISIPTGIGSGMHMVGIYNKMAKNKYKAIEKALVTESPKIDNSNDGILNYIKSIMNMPHKIFKNLYKAARIGNTHKKPPLKKHPLNEDLKKA